MLEIHLSAQRVVIPREKYTVGQHFQHFVESNVMTSGRLFADIDDARSLAQAIVDTVREPLLVLDKELRVVAASRSFYLTFRVNRQETRGQLLYSLGDGQWDIPALRTLLEKIVPEQAVLDDFQVEQTFPNIGQRTMLLNARKVYYEDNSHTTVLLAIEDITERKAAERELQELLRQKELLLDEMQHRIANSLQIIASIILLKARTVQSPETRLHLEDAHKRVMSVAAVQQHLQVSGRGELIDVATYLSKLCATLAQSMIGDGGHITIEVKAAEGGVSSSDAVSIGLIVTEAVINALKHAFAKDEVGLGTSIVNALANQLDARVDVVTGQGGTIVSIIHAAATLPMPRAA